jgi:hypothetical protein
LSLPLPLSVHLPCRTHQIIPGPSLCAPRHPPPDPSSISMAAAGIICTDTGPTVAGCWTRDKRLAPYITPRVGALCRRSVLLTPIHSVARTASPTSPQSTTSHRAPQAHVPRLRVNTSVSFVDKVATVLPTTTHGTLRVSAVRFRSYFIFLSPRGDFAVLPCWPSSSPHNESSLTRS